MFVEEFDETFEAQLTGIFVVVWRLAVCEGVFDTRVRVPLVVHISGFQFLLQCLLRWGVRKTSHLERTKEKRTTGH